MEKNLFGYYKELERLEVLIKEAKESFESDLLNELIRSNLFEEVENVILIDGVTISIVTGYNDFCYDINTSDVYTTDSYSSLNIKMLWKLDSIIKAVIERHKGVAVNE